MGGCLAVTSQAGDCQCADSSTLESGTDYAGNDIQGERHAASVQDCCELCLATPGCTCAHRRPTRAEPAKTIVCTASHPVQCEPCLSTGFQAGTGEAKGLCWTKASKSGEKHPGVPRVGATVSADYKANTKFCHSVGGTSFLLLLVCSHCPISLSLSLSLFLSLHPLLRANSPRLRVHHR